MGMQNAFAELATDRKMSILTRILRVFANCFDILAGANSAVTGGALRVVFPSNAALGQVAGVTTVGTLTNQVNIGGYAANYDQIYAGAMVRMTMRRSMRGL